MNKKTKLIVFLEELQMWYFENYDLYSAAYIEELINEVYRRCK